MKNRIAKLALAFLLGVGFTAPTSLQASEIDSGVFEFQKKLAKGGNPQAQYQLATMYESGRGVEQNLEKAQEWYRKSAAGSYKAARHRLTYLEVKVSGFKSTHKPWLQELSADAKGGDGEAMFILGHMYEYGNGVKRSLKRAQAYYKSSAFRGNVDAENRLFVVEQNISQSSSNDTQKAAAAKKQQETSAKQKAEEERKARASAAKEKAARDKAARDKALKDRKKADQERRKLEAERKKLEAERRKLQAQKRALEAQQAAEAQAAEEAAAKKAEEEKKKQENEKFQSELCSGKAARFRTQCQ